MSGGILAHFTDMFHRASVAVKSVSIDVRDDLRKDGIAATVIVAIAAAVLTSAWSSNSRAAE